MTVMQGFEQRVSSYLRRWLELPRSLSNIGLYGNSNKLRLPFRSVREEFIVARTQEHLQYSGSRDAKVARGKDHGEDREEVEGSRCSSASRVSAEAQGHPRHSGTRQSGTRDVNINPVRVCQWKGEAEAGAGGGASFIGGGVNQQSCGHEAARSLDEVGAGIGAVHHLEGHQAVEPPED